MAFFLTLLQCSNAQNEISITPADCNTIETDAGVALDLVNRHRRDGYVFGLFRVADAHELHLDFGQCKIITYTNHLLKKPQLYGFNCTLSPVPPDLVECKDCPVKLEALEVTEEHKDIAAKALRKFNSEGNHTNNFAVDKVERVLKMTASREGHILGFSIKETNCSKSTQETDQALECDFLHDWHAHTGFCKARVISDADEADGTDISCEIYHPWVCTHTMAVGEEGDIQPWDIHTDITILVTDIAISITTDMNVPPLLSPDLKTLSITPNPARKMKTATKNFLLPLLLMMNQIIILLYLLMDQTMTTLLTTMDHPFSDCDDPDVFKAVDAALKKYNEDEATGTQFALYVVMEAKRTKTGECTARVHMNDADKTTNVSQECRIFSDVSKIRLTEAPCLGCFHPISSDGSEVSEILKKAIQKFNKHSDEPALFKLAEIKEAKRQVVAGWNYIIRYKIEETNCTKDQFQDLTPECKITSRGVFFARRPPGFTPFRSTVMLSQPQALSRADKNEGESESPGTETRKDNGQEPEGEVGEEEGEVYSENAKEMGTGSG
ncbi:hypothetical protein EK904_014009, partial [Melospiza melodia maxima]